MGNRHNFLLALALLALPATARARRPPAPDPEDEVMGDLLPPERVEGASYLRLSAQTGTSGYTSAALEPKIALFEAKELFLVGGLSYLQTEPGLDSRQGQVGIEWDKRDLFSAALSVTGARGPEAVTSAGALLDASTWLNRLWGARLVTILRFGVDATNYRLPVSLLRTAYVTQTALALHLTQELFHGLAVTLGYTGFLYDRDVSVLNAAVMNGRLQFAGSIGTTAGFPTDSWLVQADWDITGRWSLEAGMSSTGGAVSSYRALGMELTPRFQAFHRWRFGATVTATEISPGVIGWSAGPEVELSW